jgi:hypothetical protein
MTSKPSLSQTIKYGTVILVGLAFVSILAISTHSIPPTQDPASAEQVCETVQTGSSYTTTCTPADQELNTPTETSSTEPMPTEVPVVEVETPPLPIVQDYVLFSDLKISNPNRYAAMTWLAKTGISVGSGCKTQKPYTHKVCKYNEGSSVNRGAMAEFIKKTVAGTNTNFNIPISDIGELNEGRQNAIKWMSENEITILDDGKYNPQNTVNRGAMAEFMYKTAVAYSGMELSLDPSLYVNEEKKFIKDEKLQELKQSNPNRYYAIMWLVKMNITEGYNEKGVLTYKPWNTVTRGAMAQFLQKLYFVMRTKEALVSPNDKDAVLISGFYEISKNNEVRIENDLLYNDKSIQLSSKILHFINTNFNINDKTDNYAIFFNFYIK